MCKEVEDAFTSHFFRLLLHTVSDITRFWLLFPFQVFFVLHEVIKSVFRFESKYRMERQHSAFSRYQALSHFRKTSFSLICYDGHKYDTVDIFTERDVARICMTSVHQTFVTFITRLHSTDLVNFTFDLSRVMARFSVHIKMKGDNNGRKGSKGGSYLVLSVGIIPQNELRSRYPENFRHKYPCVLYSSAE